MSDSGRWVSWEEAAHLAGVRVPTVEHAVRVGRIVRRPAKGSRPSLDRDSVHQWAAWYRRVQAGQAARREAREQAKRTRTRTGPRELVQREHVTASEVATGGWMSVPVAASALGCSGGTVLRWARAGRLDARLTGQPPAAVVSRKSVERVAAERAADADKWVSQVAAAELVGCSVFWVPALVAEGVLVQRSGPRGQASISRESALAAAQVWADRQAAEEEARRQRKHAHPTNAAPDDGQVWVTTMAAALALGLTRNGVGERIRVGTLPATRRGNRYWLRRVDVETAAAAAAFARRRAAG